MILRLRVQFTVGYEQKFISALDLMHLIERSLRRARIPYALSEGFNPHMKISIGTVLPVGLRGEEEYFDLELRESMELAEFVSKLNEALPAGLVINKACALKAGEPALMKIINVACYGIKWEYSHSELVRAVDSIWKESSILIKSKGKNKKQDKDVRAGIWKIEFGHETQDPELKIWVSVGEPLNIRFDELVEIFSGYGVMPEKLLEIYRIGNYIRDGEHFISPMDRGIK